MPQSICDFCSEPNVTWRYPAHSFAAYIVMGIVGESVGDWAACPVCHSLIESGNYVGLAERSLRALLEKEPEMRGVESELRAQIRGLQAKFLRSRAGAAVCLEG